MAASPADEVLGREPHLSADMPGGLLVPGEYQTDTLVDTARAYSSGGC
jgi:hypothetical protein